MEDTTVKSVNTTDIELRGILDKIAEPQIDSNDTSTPLPKEYSNTTSDLSNNSVMIKFGHNRKVCRYAKKHGITQEEAFKRLYK